MSEEELIESNKNGMEWFNAYGEVDSFIFEELHKLGEEFVVVSEEKPYQNTIESIKLLMSKTNKR